MSPLDSRRTPPACTDELLLTLRSARLLDEAALDRLGAAWGGDDPPGPHLDELVGAGLLTPFQAEHLRSGRPGRLRLGPYRLVERLGRAVFRAEHELLGRPVVLKLLGRSRRGRGGGRGAVRAEGRVRLRQSRREIRALGGLSHPHLVAAHDARWIRGRLVLVLEFVEGVDLRQMLAQCGPLPTDLVWTIAEQAADALDCLHRRGLVHRDVKPANLLLTHAADEPAAAVVKLVDLGLVCPVGSAGEGLCGTPDYLPPERGLAADAIDARGDLYSLGCTLYELLTGRVPFPGGDWRGKVIRHRFEEPTPIATLRPDAPPALVEVVARLMAREPGDRPASPAAVRALLEGARIAAVRAPAPPAPPRRRRGRWPTAAGAVAAGALLGCLARMLLTGREAVPTPVESHRPARPVVQAAGGRVGGTELASAIAAAADGAVIELTEGEYAVAPLRIQGKSLTLRGVGAARPVFRRAGEGRRWDALLASDADLTLEGIHFVGDRESLAPVVVVEGGRLRLARCGVEQRGRVPALALRRGKGLELADCQVNAAGQGLAVEVGGEGACGVRIEGSRIDVRDGTAAALLLWNAETGRGGGAEVRLRDSTVRAGRVFACRSVTGPVRLEAIGSRLGFRQALLSCDGYRRPEDWRRVVRWQGEGNRFDAAGPWLRLEGRDVPPRSEEGWRRLWDGPSGAAGAMTIVPAESGSSLRGTVGH